MLCSNNPHDATSSHALSCGSGPNVQWLLVPGWSSGRVSVWNGPASGVPAAVASRFGLSPAHQVLTLQGKPFACAMASQLVLAADATAADFGVVHVGLRLCGGKGGFGSLLRGMAAQKKTTNFDACRDLSGRRVRHVNAERDLAEWRMRQEQVEEEKRVRRAQEKHALESRARKHGAAFASEARDVAASTQDALALGLRRVSKQKEAASPAHGSPEGEQGEAVATLPAYWDPFAMGDSDGDDVVDEEGDKAGPKATCKKPGARSTAARRRGGGARGSADTEPTKKRSRGGARAVVVVDTTGCQDGGADDVAGPGTTSEAEDGAKGSPSSPCKKARGSASPAITLDSATSAKQLESLGLEHLKAQLMEKGLKCGGTLAQRATRLFSVKGLTWEQIPNKFRAKR